MNASSAKLIFMYLAAYRATDGKQLWQFDAGTGIIAPPMTFSIGGTQYLTVMAGWGGAPAMFNAPGGGPVKPGYGRILTIASSSIKQPIPNLALSNAMRTGRPVCTK